jgi:CBS domain-containing protein
MSTKVPEQLKEISEQANQGIERGETVRTLLSWFSAERRGKWTVGEIRKALAKVKLVTEPDFEGVWIDSTVIFRPKPRRSKKADSTKDTIAGEPESTKTDELTIRVTKKSVDDLNSSIKIKRLDAANNPPVCVSPDASISEAITLMLQYDFSQLPVVTTPRDLKGLLSWKSLGSRLALGKPCKRVRECMETAVEVSPNASLFNAIQSIVEHECVLVRDETRNLTGIVTTADLSLQFRDLGEPFLVLGQIESHIRNLIADRYQKAELIEACDPSDSGREIESVSDLTLGEYIRLLESPKRWEKLSIPIDRRTFTDELKKIGRIRNDVMHFDPDGVAPEDLTILRKFLRFLSDLEEKLG